MTLEDLTDADMTGFIRLCAALARGERVRHSWRVNGHGGRIVRRGGR